jgi:hypothetical protein
MLFALALWNAPEEVLAGREPRTAVSARAVEVARLAAFQKTGSGSLHL